MSKIDEEEAARTLDFLKLMGEVWDDERAQFSAEAPL
jgi:hydrogenase maturation factor